MQWMEFMKFVECIWSKTDHFMGNLGANTIKHVSKKELFILFKFINFRKEFYVESGSFSHEILEGQLIKMARRICNNFNKVKFSMENHTFSTY